MSTILAIDPGNTDSGWCIIDATTYRPKAFSKTENHELFDAIKTCDVSGDLTVIEMIGHYGTGMPAGKTVFDTCRWIGRLEMVIKHSPPFRDAELVLRPTIKTHLCGSAKAKDPNVRQALVDRFAPGQPNHGKGTKKSPGWFYGFHSDIWQAYALAVYAADTRRDDQ